MNKEELRKSLGKIDKLAASGILLKDQLHEESFNKDTTSDESKRHKRIISNEVSQWPIAEENSQKPDANFTGFLKEVLDKYKNEKQSEITSELFVLLLRRL